MADKQEQANSEKDIRSKVSFTTNQTNTTTRPNQPYNLESQDLPLLEKLRRLQDTVQYFD